MQSWVEFKGTLFTASLESAQPPLTRTEKEQQGKENVMDIWKQKSFFNTFHQLFQATFPPLHNVWQHATQKSDTTCYRWRIKTKFVLLFSQISEIKVPMVETFFESNHHVHPYKTVPTGSTPHSAAI